MLAFSDTNPFGDVAKSNPTLLLAAAVLGLCVGLCFFKPFFGDWSGFWECVKFWFTPDVVSMVRGQWEDDRWSTLKLFVWLGLTVGAAISAFYQLPSWLPNLFHGT